MRAQPAVTVGADGLSCYTANLAAYLDRYPGDALDRIARSVRLAVRTDLPAGLLAFSHHDEPLNVVDGHSRLEYASAPEPDRALEAVTHELTDHGQVLVLANAATMAWSVTGSAPAPHFLLVDDRRPARTAEPEHGLGQGLGLGQGQGLGLGLGRGTEWHVVDRFTALRPEGHQPPFTGWISTPALLRCLTPITPQPAVHRLRNEHAFGFPASLPPEGQHQWLARTGPPDMDHGQTRLPGRWLTDIAEVLELLEALWTTRPDPSRHLDDLWAAAQHRTFRYARLRQARAPTGLAAAALDEAAAAWRDLPMALHFANHSARRGRPRPAMVKATFARLRQAELAAHEVATALGYANTTTDRTPDWKPR